MARMLQEKTQTPRGETQGRRWCEDRGRWSTGVMGLQAKKQQELAAATRSYRAGMEQVLAQSLPREATLLTP